MKTKVRAVIVGALVTLFLWAMVFIVLNSVYRGNLPWLLAGLAALLCPVLGGYIATRREQTDGMRLGAIAGLAAGLLILLLAAVVSRLAPNTTFAGGVLVVVGAAGGGMGTWSRHSTVRIVLALAVSSLLVVLFVSACAPGMTGIAETMVPLEVEDASFNLVEQAGLGSSVMIEVMEFDLDRSGNEMDPYVHRLTITDTQTLDLFVDALDTDLQLALKVECIPEYELFFHLQDGTVQEFGYSCGGASFIRGKQDFWDEQDYHPPERFDALIEEQLALNPPETAPTLLVGTAWMLVSLNGEDFIVNTKISLEFTQDYLQGSMTCNGYGGGLDSGRYIAQDDGTLTLPYPIAVTVQECAMPKGVMEQEAVYMKALQSAATYRVVEGHLEIDNGAGETTLVFARK